MIFHPFFVTMKSKIRRIVKRICITTFLLEEWHGFGRWKQSLKSWFLILAQMCVQELWQNLPKSKFLLYLKTKNRQSTKNNKKLFHFTSFCIPFFALMLFEFVFSLCLSFVWSHESAGYLVERGDCVMCWYACMFHMFSTKFKCTYHANEKVLIVCVLRIEHTFDFSNAAAAAIAVRCDLLLWWCWWHATVAVAVSKQAVLKNFAVYYSYFVSWIKLSLCESTVDKNNRW